MNSKNSINFFLGPMIQFTLYYNFTFLSPLCDPFIELFDEYSRLKRLQKNINIKKYEFLFHRKNTDI